MTDDTREETLGDDEPTVWCARCGRSRPSFSREEIHPLGGLAFRTYGHYGSSHFDPIDGDEYIDLCVCDPCVVELEARGIARRGRSSR